MLKQTTIYNVSLHLDAKFQKCHLQFDAVSACSLVQGLQHVLFRATNDCCLLVSRTLPVCLSNVAPVSLEHRCCFEWCRFRSNFGRMKFVFFAVLKFMQLSSGFTFGDNVTFSVVQLSV